MYILSASSLCRSFTAIVWQNGDDRTLPLFHCIKIYQNRAKLKQSILFNIAWNFYLHDWHAFILFFILSSCGITSVVVVLVYRYASHTTIKIYGIYWYQSLNISNTHIQFRFLAILSIYYICVKTHILYYRNMYYILILSCSERIFR